MRSADAGRHLPQCKIEDILLSKGKTTEEQLEEALEIQKAEGGSTRPSAVPGAEAPVSRAGWASSNSWSSPRR